MARPKPISAPDRLRLQLHLRATLESPRLWIDAPSARGGTAQVRVVGSGVIGTVDQVDDEGERSWAVTLIVLADDLPPV